MRLPEIREGVFVKNTLEICFSSDQFARPATMKPIRTSEATHKFQGTLRHYHRTGANTRRSWDEWVEGTSNKTKSSRNWLKITAIVVSVLALTGIIAGLVIELG